MDYNELIALWTKAFNWLYEKDVALFETDVQERAIAGRLAMYLQHEFDPHYEKTACIDLEYNREGNGVKRPHPRNEEGWIAPDILLHVRKKRENIFYCEVKKKSDTYNADSVRVKDALVDRKYQYGLNLYYVRADCAKVSIYTWIGNNIQKIDYVYGPTLKQLKALGDAEYLKQ
ncbi:hypothetical protein [Faecalibacterium sp. 9]|uniref:hypothetical protein n=1 Tax=Faecalibacterium sp. 9 TaxID=3402018 RepID=UPI003AB09DBD